MRPSCCASTSESASQPSRFRSESRERRNAHYVLVRCKATSTCSITFALEELVGVAAMSKDPSRCIEGGGEDKTAQAASRAQPFHPQEISRFLWGLPAARTLLVTPGWATSPLVVTRKHMTHWWHLDGWMDRCRSAGLSRATTIGVQEQQKALTRSLTSRGTQHRLARGAMDDVSASPRVIDLNDQAEACSIEKPSRSLTRPDGQLVATCDPPTSYHRVRAAARRHSRIASLSQSQPSSRLSSRVPQVKLTWDRPPQLVAVMGKYFDTDARDSMMQCSAYVDIDHYCRH